MTSFGPDPADVPPSFSLGADDVPPSFTAADDPQYGFTSPDNPVSNLFIGPVQPAMPVNSLWIQTGLGVDGKDFTFWIEDGT